MIHPQRWNKLAKILKSSSLKWEKSINLKTSMSLLHPSRQKVGKLQICLILISDVKKTAPNRPARLVSWSHYLKLTKFSSQREKLFQRSLSHAAHKRLISRNFKMQRIVKSGIHQNDARISFSKCKIVILNQVHSRCTNPRLFQSVHQSKCLSLSTKRTTLSQAQSISKLS